MDKGALTPGRRRFLALMAALAVVRPPRASADATVTPPARLTDDVILEIDVDAGDTVAFDLEALDALPQHRFDTSTIWTDGVRQFSGPPLAAVLGAAGLDPQPIQAFASNGYGVTLTFPPGDALVPIVATRIDGAPIGRRERGPLWVMFPFDSDASLRNAEVFGQSIWHLVRLSNRPDTAS
jgi:hypothetical protein